MCRFEPSYLAVTICKDSESSAKGHRLPHDKKRLDSVYWNRGQKCKASAGAETTTPVVSVSLGPAPHPPPSPVSAARALPPSPVYKSALHALTSELFAGAPSRAPRWSSSLAALALSLVTRSTHTEVGALARQLIGSMIGSIILRGSHPSER